MRERDGGKCRENKQSTAVNLGHSFLWIVCSLCKQHTHTHSGTGKTLGANLKQRPPHRSRPLSLIVGLFCVCVCGIFLCDSVLAGQTSCPVPERVIVALSVLGRTEALREESDEPTGMNILILVIQ